MVKKYAPEKHAKLSPSKGSWIKATDEEIVTYYKRLLASDRGTRLHEIAAKLIHEGIKLEHDDTAFTKYVNDCIEWGMEPEVLLMPNDICFGTADSLCYNYDTKTLHIWDLKTGSNEVNTWNQLEIYAALWCICSDIPPKECHFDLRYYQFKDFKQLRPTGDRIAYLAHRIRRFSEILEDYKED